VFDNLINLLDGAGVKVVSLVFGAIGAALGIAYSPQMTRREMFAALLAGLVCASIMPQVLLHYLALPGWASNAAAFIFGVGGMFLVPGLIALWRGFAANPWGLLDWIRGGGSKGGQP